MTNLVTLMYHAVYAGAQEYADIPDEDKPYAIHKDEFEAHLKWLSAQDVNVIDPNFIFKDASDSKTNILITFDDGHIGFYLYAFPLLCKYKFKAIFFITTDFIGNRKEFCSWQQLDEMSRGQMLIHSHGVTHKFFEDMSDSDMLFEFDKSKSEIEKYTQCKVWSISFPGGRFNSTSLVIGEGVGYTHFFTSESKQTCLPISNFSKIGRFAIKNSSTVIDIDSFINPSLVQKLKSRVVATIKWMLKKVLGNNGYHKLYKVINKSERVS